MADRISWVWTDPYVENDLDTRQYIVNVDTGALIRVEAPVPNTGDRWWKVVLMFCGRHILGSYDERSEASEALTDVARRLGAGTLT